MVAVEGVEEPVAQDEVLQPVAHLDEREVHASALSSSSSCSSIAGRGHVDVGDRLALQDDPRRVAARARAAGSGGGTARRWRRTAAPPTGRRRCRAAVGRPGGRSTSVPAVDAVDLAEHGAVGPPAAPEEQEDRQHDREDDALEHAEEHDAGGGDEREHAAPTCGPASSGGARARSISDSAAAMTTAASAVWGRSASSELRNSRSTATRPAPTRPVSWRLGARLLGHRGARAAGRDGEALEEPGGDVGGADADHLLVGVDLVAAPGGEARRGGDRVGERHERDADGRDEQRDRRRWPRVHGNARGRARPGEATRPSRRRRAARSSTAETIVAPTTATSTAGIAGTNAGSTSSTTSTHDADDQRRRVGLVEVRGRTASISSTKPSASVEKPNSFGSWPTMIVMARPFM